MNFDTTTDFEIAEIRKTRLRVKIAQEVRRMNRLIKDYQTAETDDEKNFIARRIGMKQDTIDTYNHALALMERS